MAEDFQSRFVIPFSGLKTGIHLFEFQVDDSFFELFEYPEVKGGNVTVKVSMDKHENMLVLDFSLEGTVLVECDRCLGLFYMPVNGRERLVARFGDADEEVSEELVTINESGSKMVLDKYIFEYISLLVPMKHTHPNDENGLSLCDPEVMKLLETHQSNETDPRWDALKNLKQDDKND